MQLIRTIEQWRQLKLSNSVGFVPTMGNLHLGHLSLIERSVSENQQTVLSIFVNPTQFNDNADYQNYPNTITNDIQLAQNAKVDYLFMPDKQQLYPDDYRYQVHETVLSTLMEGEQRPGHFTGMLTIVLKLLCLIRPQKIYLGEKDYQQLRLVQGLCEAFLLDIAVIPCHTIREADGLAFSSRNSRLSDSARQKAAKFPQLLNTTYDINLLKNQLINQGFTVEYVYDYQGRRYAAVQLENVRLIDNIPLPICI